MKYCLLMKMKLLVLFLPIAHDYDGKLELIQIND